MVDVYARGAGAYRGHALWAELAQECCCDVRSARVPRLRRSAASVAVLAAARRARVAWVAWITGHIDLGVVMTASSPFTVHRSPFTVHRSPFTVHRSPFTALET